MKHANMRLWLCTGLLASALGASTAQADTIYLCKAYSGGQFWSREHCQTRQALVERMVDVPSGMGFKQQVQVAQQGVHQTERALRETHGPASRAEREAQQREARAQQRQQAQCAGLTKDLQHQESLARMGGSGRKMARISERQRQLREEQARKGC